jgi:hypothetical protein
MGKPEKQPVLVRPGYYDYIVIIIIYTTYLLKRIIYYSYYYNYIPRGDRKRTAGDGPAGGAARSGTARTLLFNYYEVFILVSFILRIHYYVLYT